MHMTQSPILEAGGLQVRETAWSIGIVAGSSRKARVHDADVHGACDRRLVLCDQAFRSVRLRETQAMDCDWEMARVAVDGHCFSATAEDLHGVRKGQFLRYSRKR